LIGQASNFAEAYNQRAIAHFVQGHFQESAADCERVLERNPYHFGALGGLAQCQLALGQRPEALKTLRRALRLQPYSEGLRELVATLEAEGK
jgi:tetratricopeptide (TPR) repeat protein